MNQHREDENLEIDVQTLEKLEFVERRRDIIREKIALRLTYAIIILSLAPILGAVVFPGRASAIRDVAVSIIPAVVGIYGTIIGFYFGEKK